MVKILSFEMKMFLTIVKLWHMILGKHMSRNHMLLTESATEQIQRQFFTAFPQIDANALNDIEIEAQYLAANLDGITENLANLLHSVWNSTRNQCI